MEVSLVTRLEQSLFQMQDAIRKYQAYLKGMLNLTEVEFEIVKFVSENERAKMREIGQHLKIHLSTLTNVADKLVRARIVKRVPSKKDRRAIYLVLTPKGESIYARYKRMLHVTALKIEQPMSTERFRYLVEGIEVVHEHLHLKE